ncbi:MAG: RNA polymerase sigma factor (sigma-70 family) [Verrucomicrobiales bacterium]
MSKLPLGLSKQRKIIGRQPQQTVLSKKAATKKAPSKKKVPAEEPAAAKPSAAEEIEKEQEEIEVAPDDEEGNPKKKRAAKYNYPATRKTLIQRLQDWDDQASWDEFFRTYSGFVFKVACKAGLSETEANEVVQETFIRVAKNMRKKTFTRDGGSFKAWLMNQTRWRIADQFRARKSQEIYSGRPRDAHDDRNTATMDMIPDDSNNGFEYIWEREWKGSLTDMALRRVKAKVSPQQYQIFYCYVVKAWTVDEVRKELGVSAAQVYLAKHRVGRIMRKELEYLDKEE